jgi:hypothetical protein
MRGISHHVRGFGMLYGFDSFAGLPEETPGLILEGKHWRPGGFSAADALREWRLPDVLDRVRRHIGHANTTLIAGFFNTSLASAARAHTLQPALLVDIDVDLHSSTSECLSWLVEERLLQPGTLVRYDDWRSMGQRHGEARAHREVSRRYNITWRNIDSRGSLNSREWEVVSIGSRVPLAHLQFAPAAFVARRERRAELRPA